MIIRQLEVKYVRKSRENVKGWCSSVFLCLSLYPITSPSWGIPKMKKLLLLLMALGLSVFCSYAQTELNDSVKPQTYHLESNLKPQLMMSSPQYDAGLLQKPLESLSLNPQATKLDVSPSLYDNRRGSWEINTMQGGKLFQPWRGAYIVASGGVNVMPGLLDRESGALTLQQNLGRWTFSASVLADKYRFSSMGFLETRYGVGGTVGYRVNERLSLHAFGYYYANSSMISPMVNPYLATSTYGGYADIRVSKYFGVDTGVRRYLNPMTGKWVTDPIVSPYIKINGKQKIGFDFGRLLKGLIWGNDENMLPRGPVRMGPPPPRR